MSLLLALVGATNGRPRAADRRLYIHPITAVETFTEVTAPKSNESSCCGARQPLRLKEQACVLPTAATRSARFPIPPHPQILVVFYHGGEGMSTEKPVATGFRNLDLRILRIFSIHF